MNTITKRTELDYLNCALLTETTESRLRPMHNQNRLKPRPTMGKVMAVPARAAIMRAQGIAGDDSSSQLVNFPFAMTAFLALGSGLLAMCCGMVGASEWLTVLGFILTLVGGGMYGWSLSDT